MQYSVIPVPQKRRGKHEVFPEKYHLELHKSTNNFKTDSINHLNSLQYHEIVLSADHVVEKPKHIEIPFTGIPSELSSILPDVEITNTIPFVSKMEDAANNTNVYQPAPKIMTKKETMAAIRNNLLADSLNNNQTTLNYSDNKKPDINIKTHTAKIYSQKSAAVFNTFYCQLNATIIPKKIFCCWGSFPLPDKMQQAIETNRKINPDFEFYVYDDNMCRKFLQNHFNEDVCAVFDIIIPGAYKADFWRLCILYIYGGIYVDIKYVCVNGFRFSFLLDKERLVLDLPSNDWNPMEHGIYNALMVCLPRNEVCWKGILKIVENVRNKYYGRSCLYPTGPGMLGQIVFSQNEIKNNKETFIAKLESFDLVFSNDIHHIIFQNTAILEIYSEYRKEQSHAQPYYSSLWKKRKIYDRVAWENWIQSSKILPIPPSVSNPYKPQYIPLTIYQTWYSKTNLPNLIQAYSQMIQMQNPEFEYCLFDDTDCQNFISAYFDTSVVQAFHKLVPGAYKADLFRYCVLYINGGIYLDIKYIGFQHFRFIDLLEKYPDQDIFVYDIENSRRGIYNACMICKPKNPLLKIAIDQIVENTKNKYYGENSLCPTGPLLLKSIFEKNPVHLENTHFLVHREIIFPSTKNGYSPETKYYIADEDSGKNILYFSNEYRNFQKTDKFKAHYSELWTNKKIYL